MTLNECLLAVCEKCNYFSINELLANTVSNLYLIINELRLIGEKVGKHYLLNVNN